MTRYWSVLWVLVAACGSSGRFRDQPIVWRVTDSYDIPEPSERPFLKIQYFANVLAFHRLLRAMDLPDQEPARNTNALDEVPDSSWFENRIGVRHLSAQEAIDGAKGKGPPQLPLSVTGGKVGGGNPGFFAQDTRGVKYLIKFDTKDNPQMQTATGVIVNRFFWALGYHVPSDHIFSLTPQNLSIQQGATMRNAMGSKIPLTQEALLGILKNAPKQSNGTLRAFASEFLPGVPKGGFAATGLRTDDPNDHIPHEHRRELRGLKVFAAWLGHTDMKEDNSLDMYVEQNGRHFLRHYLLDFGEALGAHQAEKARLEDGWEHIWDWQNNTLALLAFGLWKRPWEDQRETPWLSIGAFSAEHFEPNQWREAYPYFPFFESDKADLYWGAKLVMRFDRHLVRAIVGTGEFSTPDATDYLIDALMKRRKKIGQTWIEAVTPLDYFSIQGANICAKDLGVFYQLASDGVVERLPHDYNPEFDDTDLEQDRQVEEFRVHQNGNVCWPAKKGSYVIDRLRVRRGRYFKPIMELHYKGGQNPHVIGIIRTPS